MNPKEIFKNEFGLPREGFSEPIDLNDTEIGFSVYKDRSVEGFKSLFRVFIKNSVLQTSDTLKPLVVTASYGKMTKEGIVIASNEVKPKINWPIEMVTTEDEFSYDIGTRQF